MVWGSRVTVWGSRWATRAARRFAMATAAPTGASHRSSPAAGCGSRRCAASPLSANDPGPVGPSQDPRTRHRLRSQDRRSRNRRGRLRLLAPTTSSRSDPTFVAGSSACHHDSKFVTLGPMGPPLEEAATSLDSRPDPPTGSSDGVAPVAPLLAPAGGSSDGSVGHVVARLRWFARVVGHTTDLPRLRDSGIAGTLTAPT